MVKKKHVITIWLYFFLTAHIVHVPRPMLFNELGNLGNLGSKKEIHPLYSLVHIATNVSDDHFNNSK